MKRFSPTNDISQHGTSQIKTFLKNGHQAFNYYKIKFLLKKSLNIDYRNTRFTLLSGLDMILSFELFYLRLILFYIILL